MVEPFEPTQERIERMTREIRAKWTPAERARRAGRIYSSNDRVYGRFDGGWTAPQIDSKARGRRDPAAKPE